MDDGGIGKESGIGMSVTVVEATVGITMIGEKHGKIIKSGMSVE